MVGRMSLRLEARTGMLRRETEMKRLIFLDRLSLVNDSSEVTGSRLSRCTSMFLFFTDW